MTQLFEYVIFLQGKKNRDGDVKEKPEIVAPLALILAEDQEQATLLAGRAIPEEYLDRIDRLTVAVRPF